MDKAEAIEALRTSDLPGSEKQRLIRLIEDKGWDKESQEEIVSTIRRAAAAAKSALALGSRFRMEAPRMKSFRFLWLSFKFKVLYPVVDGIVVVWQMFRGAGGKTPS